MDNSILKKSFLKNGYDTAYEDKLAELLYRFCDCLRHNTVFFIM